MRSSWLAAGKAQRDTRDDAAARRITELYTKAAEQLGSDKAPVRLAGLYALERLAQDNPAQRQTIVNVLCAYLRMPYEPIEPPPGEVGSVNQGTDAGQPVDDLELMDTAHVRQRLEEQQVRKTAQNVLLAHLLPAADEHGVPTHPHYWEDIELDLNVPH